MWRLGFWWVTFSTYSTADIPLIHQLDVSIFACAILVSFPDPLEVGSGDETSAIHLCRSIIELYLCSAKQQVDAGCVVWACSFLLLNIFQYKIKHWFCHLCVCCSQDKFRWSMFHNTMYWALHCICVVHHRTVHVYIVVSRRMFGSTAALLRTSLVVKKTNTVGASFYKHAVCVSDTESTWPIHKFTVSCYIPRPPLNSTVVVGSTTMLRLPVWALAYQTIVLFNIHITSWMWSTERICSYNDDYSEAVQWSLLSQVHCPALGQSSWAGSRAARLLPSSSSLPYAVPWSSPPLRGAQTVSRHVGHSASGIYEQ